MMKELYTINANDKQLRLIYSKREAGLFEYHSSDKAMYAFTHEQTEKAFLLAVSKEADNLYELNIASTENFSMFDGWKSATALLHRQLDIFMPIIQKFMEYALTNQI